jgi:hypothetical protein
MIGHDFQFNHRRLKLSGALLDDFFQALIHAVDQHRAPILGTPDNVILAGIHYMPIALVLWFGRILSSHVLHYTAIYYLMSSVPA